MSFLAISSSEVDRLLPMPACIEVISAALLGLQRGEFDLPLRTVYTPPGARGRMSWMPAYRSGAEPAFGTKLLCVMPGNPTLGLEAHQGAVMFFSAATGELEALMPASTITAIRTAAASAVATRMLAREDAGTLAIIGTGVQAHRHLQSISAVRRLREIRISGRTAERAQEFVAKVRSECDFPIHAVGGPAEAVRGADIIVTATSVAEPFFEREWVEAGAHINAVGASRPTHRELDTATVAASELFTDRRESLESEAADYRLALAEGLIGPGHLRGELGQLLAGEIEGRSSAGSITLFRSLGVAAEDLAVAQFVAAEAARLGAGTRVEF